MAKHNLVCQGPGDLIWIIVLYAYILLTQLFSVILAFKTRKVEIEILNDAKYVALIIYITSIILVIMIVCAILLSNYLNADGAVFGALLHIFTTTVLMIVFIPKVSEVIAMYLPALSPGFHILTTLHEKEGRGDFVHAVTYIGQDVTS